ncbi:MAG: DUF4864 domain-containing protein [Hyphomicrobiales bacterium]|nr:DUF4864 domain-containing protein [Hyphomicrobiales bacterium]MDE2017015.1 DUF4864 domain-containing protein [Hyphomicrobiales bacterium]
MTTPRSALASIAALLAIASPAGAADAPFPQAQAVIEGQFAAFAHGDGAAAYAYAAPNIRRIFPDAGAFMAMVARGYAPVLRHRAATFLGAAATAGGVTQDVLLIDADGAAWTARYTLEREPDGTWRISGCVLLKRPEVSS